MIFHLNQFKTILMVFLLHFGDVLGALPAAQEFQVLTDDGRKNARVHLIKSSNKQELEKWVGFGRDLDLWETRCQKELEGSYFPVSCYLIVKYLELYKLGNKIKIANSRQKLEQICRRDSLRFLAFAPSEFAKLSNAVSPVCRGRMQKRVEMDNFAKTDIY